MQMLRRDYIMKMIEEFARVIAKVVLLKQTRSYTEARLELDELSILITGFSILQVKTLGAEGLLYVLGGREGEAEKIYCTARILKEEAMIFEEEGSFEKSLKSYILAKELFELASNKEFDERPESLAEAEILQDKIQKHPGYN